MPCANAYGESIWVFGNEDANPLVLVKASFNDLASDKTYVIFCVSKKQNNNNVTLFL